MGSLADIIQRRQRDPELGRSGIEQGKIFTYIANTQETQYWNNCFCWSAPGDGFAVVEIWGASGSSGRQCCCSSSLPGNPGAYSKKTVCVTSGDWIRGIPGMACGARGDNDLCFKGCSESTCITLCTASNGCECMCAVGGIGGHSLCSTGFHQCCWNDLNFKTTMFPTGCNCNTCCCDADRAFHRNCGIVCNFRFIRDYNEAEAFGGDVNKNGGISCMSFYSACAFDGGGNCRQVKHVMTSPAIIAEDGALLTFPHGHNTGPFANASGAGFYGLINALNAAGKRPSNPTPHVQCNGWRIYGCYEAHGCGHWLPPGVPGAGSGTQGDVRDQGERGGPGLVRIKFIGS